MNTKDFTKKYYTKRKNTDCVKWDNPDVKNKLPMFIADMDFKTEPKIIEALQKRIKHGSFGYSFLPKDYYDIVSNWNKKRNGLTIKKDWVRFSKGAVDAIYQIIYAFTNPKDNILITTPVYPPFSDSITKTNRTLITSKLILNNSLFTFDYDDIEHKIIEKNIKMIILCSPHNPLGRVWTKTELTRLLRITSKHNVLVLSDEVHSDIIMPKYKFIPTLKLKEYQNTVISISSASKTFSLAIFNHCHIFIPNKELRDTFDKYQQENHRQAVNILDAYPTYYGYKYGEKWLEDVIKVIEENYNYLTKRLKPYLSFLPLQGTYLMFIDFSKYTKNGYKFLYDKCNIVPNPGETFCKDYSCWVRLNLATSLDNIKKACDQIENTLLKLTNH